MTAQRAEQLEQQVVDLAMAKFDAECATSQAKSEEESRRGPGCGACPTPEMDGVGVFPCAPGAGKWKPDETRSNTP